MPITRLSLPEATSNAQAQALVEAVQRAFVATCDVPAEDLFFQIVRFAPQDRVLHPTYGGVERSSGVVIAEITFLQGRDDARKRALFREIAKGATACGLRGDDILIYLQENGPIDWSLGRGEAFLDVKAG